jgi:hypothetical protein
MSKRVVLIDKELYDRSEAKAAEKDTTVSAVIEAYLRSWVETTDTVPESVTRIREEIYVVQPGDTLAQIARRMYGDARKYTLIAEYNDITDVTKLRISQRLRIPFPEVVETELAGRPFRFPLDETETPYYKFGNLYSPRSSWAGKPHPGVDFHERKGANVYAIGEGTVIVNRFDARGYGHYLMIEHRLTTGQKVWSLYGHLQVDDQTFTSPRVGAKIEGEDVVIGKEGETGAAGVPHVHFEMKKSDELSLYPMINEFNLRDYFYDPYDFIRDPKHRCLPVRAFVEPPPEEEVATPDEEEAVDVPLNQPIPIHAEGRGIPR